MLYPHLLRAALPIFVVGAIVLAAVLIALGLLPVFGIERSPWMTRLPWILVLGWPLLFCGLLWQAARHDRRVEEMLRANGAAATATVAEVRETGMEASGLTLLEVALQVTPSDAAPFRAQATVKASVPTIERYRPGSEVRVRYDPSDHSRLIVEE